jgi:hypothetical protein
MTKPRTSPDDKIREISNKHFSSYVEPLLLGFSLMHNIDISVNELQFHRFNYVSSAIHFAKHQRNLLGKE